MNRESYISKSFRTRKKKYIYKLIGILKYSNFLSNLVVVASCFVAGFFLVFLYLHFYLFIYTKSYSTTVKLLISLINTDYDIYCLTSLFILINTLYFLMFEPAVPKRSHALRHNWSWLLNMVYQKLEADLRVSYLTLCFNDNLCSTLQFDIN